MAEKFEHALTEIGSHSPNCRCREQATSPLMDGLAALAARDEAIGELVKAAEACTEPCSAFELVKRVEGELAKALAAYKKTEVQHG